jgi:hypothetical protein
MAKTQAPSAKKQAEAELVTDNALVPADKAGALADIPEFMRADIGSSEGTEGLGMDDVQMPRLAIAQTQTPAMLPNRAEYIRELKLGDLFNTLTGDIYEQPVEFIVVRRDPPRWIEFDEDRKVVDRDVRPGDPRTFWTDAIDEKTKQKYRKKPIATQFYDFVVLLLPDFQPIALSFSRTGIKAAKRLNGLIKTSLPPLPVYARKFVMETKLEVDPASQGTFGIHLIRNGGRIQDAETYAMAKQAFEAFKNRVIDIHREAEDETGIEDGGPVADGYENRDVNADM